MLASRRRMKRPAGTVTIDSAWRLLGAFGLLALAACATSQDGGSPHDSGQERRIWNSGSVAIDFTLTGPIANFLCSFSATREELSSAQIQGLAALMLHDASGGA